MAVRESVPVEEVMAAIVAKLHMAGYMESTIRLQSRVAKRLGEWCHEHGDGHYTTGLGAAFAAATTSPKTGRFSQQRYQSFGRLNRLADSFLLTGVVDLAAASRTRGTKPMPVSPDLAGLLAAWEQNLIDRRMSEEYRNQSCDQTRQFLIFVEQRGRSTVGEITGGDVADYIAVVAATYPNDGGRTLISVFKPFLTFTGHSTWITAGSMMRLQRKRVILEPHTDTEMATVFDHLAAGQVTARDQAIVLLSLTSGLRACDIVGLMIEDIDWRTETIRLIQSKTGNPLTLPLLPAVGNALTQYLLHDRPDTTDRHVFVRTKAPHHKLSGHSSIYCVMKRVFAGAGLAPGRCGTLLSRHSAASRMLIAGTPLPTISAVLGHTRPESVDRYLQTDTDQLRACVLPLPEAVQP